MKIDFYLFFSFQLPIFFWLLLHDLKVNLIFLTVCTRIEVEVNFNKVFKESHHYHFELYPFHARGASCFSYFPHCCSHPWVNMCVLYFYYVVTCRALNDCVFTISRTRAPFGVSIYNRSVFNEDFSSFNHFSLATTTEIYIRVCWCVYLAYMTMVS